MVKPDWNFPMMLHASNGAAIGAYLQEANGKNL